MNEIRILVVEPDATLLYNVAEKILRPQGFFPLEAQSLSDGIRRAQAGSPKVILLHANGESAIQFLNRVIELSGYIVPTILVVEQSMAQLDVKLLRLGVKDYLTWPVVPEELLKAIQRVIGVLPHQTVPFSFNGQHMKFEFADMASHLMRNPLSVIQTSVKCLQTLELAPVEQKKLLDKIWKQSQQLTTFTNELLRMFQIEVEGSTYSKIPVDLTQLLNKVINTMCDEEPHIKIEADFSGEMLPTVAGDPSKTEIILLSLLKGAVRRCSSNGHISVDVNVDTAEVVVSIKDNGKPIPIESINNVFQPYYSTGHSQLRIPSNYQLGLYTTKKLVELQKGRIWAEALSKDSGSKFYFSLPIWEHS